MFLLEFHSAVFSFEELTEEQAASLTMDWDELKAETKRTHKREWTVQEDTTARSC